MSSSLIEVDAGRLRLPDKPALEGLEFKWMPRWEESGVYRFDRRRGKAVFYPMGWDDNGLPTERRVQNYYGVRCDPSLPYDPAFTPPAKPDPKKQIPISRQNFVDLCG